jgi:hypothetical protein
MSCFEFFVRLLEWGWDLTMLGLHVAGALPVCCSGLGLAPVGAFPWLATDMRSGQRGSSAIC